MRIEFLADHPSFVTQVATWCNEEWPWYYDGGNLNSALVFHQRTAQRSSVPCALVAVQENELLGTVAIIESDMETRPNLGPWLGCLYVAPEYRGRGVAGQLIKEGLNLAKLLKVKELYAWTESLTKPLKRNGWSLVETTIYHAREVDILSYST